MKRRVEFATRRVAIGACCLWMGLTPAAAAQESVADAASQITGAQPAASAPRWALRLPEKHLLTYRSAVSWDEAGTAGGAMVYPAFDGITMLAGVLTHAILVGSTRSREKDALQAKADEALLPYRPLLEADSPQDLCRRAIARAGVSGAVKLVEAQQSSDADLHLSIAPNFVFAQDQRSLALENAVLITKTGAPAASASPLLVRVVSDAWPAAAGDDPAAYWSADDGARLKEITATLLAHSLDVAVSFKPDSAHDSSERSFRTHRYTEGRTERMERGQMVQQHCGRAVIKTLRGVLLSVPLRSADAGSNAGCAPTATATASP